MLFVKKLDPRATLPTCAHPGEDLAYDLYALEDTLLVPGVATVVPTGVALQFRARHPYTADYTPLEKYGLLIRDRSSMAVKGITVSAGVIDAGYTGECNVVLTFHSYLTDDELQFKAGHGFGLRAGDKIAQVIPIPVLTREAVEVIEELDGERGTSGYGSTGR